MFGTAIDMAIGLVLMFLLFSILLTIAMEIISGVCGLWSKALENSLAQLIENPQPTGSASMFGGHAAAAQADGPAPAVAAAAAAGPASFKLPYESIYRHPLVAGIGEPKRPSYVPGANVAGALVDVLGRRGGGSTFAAVQIAVGQLTNGKLQTALQTLLDQAGGDLNAFRSNVATWFDSAMDRLSGAYKRFTQVITFVMGLTFAAVFNVDAVNVARTLYADPPLRTAMVAAAEKQVKAGAPTTSGAAAIGDQIKDYVGAERSLTEVAPIGWTGWPNAFDFWVGVGWLLTALSGLLGAPFWFDTLKTLVNVRNAGPKPDTTTSSGP